MKAIGIDIGGTTVKAGLVDGRGRVHRQKKAATPSNARDFQALVSSLVRALGNDAAGIGIGCKGIIDPVSTRVINQPGPISFLQGLELAAMIGSHLPVFADNDARAAMVGEMLWGAAKGRANALMFTLGTGVGGAILAEGRILQGAGGVAGHLGHVTIDPDGPLCICGNRGCLETAFSARAIESEARRAVHAGVSTALARGRLTCKAVFEAAAEGDSVAVQIRDRAISRLGAAIAGLALALDPEIVIVGGRIAEAGESLMRPLRREIHGRSRALLGRAVPIVPTGVTGSSGIAGAAGLFFLAYAEPLSSSQ